MKRALLAIALVLAGCGGGSKPAKTPESFEDNEKAMEKPAASADDAGAPVASASDGGSTDAIPTTPEAKPDTASAKPDDTPKGTEEGAQNVLKQFVAAGADQVTLTKALRPTSADFKSLFDSTIAGKIEAAQNKDWDSGSAVLKPKAGQTEVKLWAASTKDFVSGQGNAKEFPGEYKKLAKHFLPDVTFYRFKFVAPGKDVGTAYEGLTFVNGHWVIVPKPWHGIDGKDAKPEKEKKPKKKKK